MSFHFSMMQSPRLKAQLVFFLSLHAFFICCLEGYTENSKAKYKNVNKQLCFAIDWVRTKKAKNKAKKSGGEGSVLFFPIDRFHAFASAYVQNKQRNRNCSIFR
ncbi:hypothetical protein BX661DRAFT_55923 [Kickxella alabastrina]|uniref:uncharacterized protein n=1 Tax=Kickxella alabastrina TaxID=61397 RepID=UPI0022207D0D|nr:uncharacterized protein BX661DRAFT_55923 [Kickxella alabastrina]KAI7823444.1 hypothetical protein BX661DRAFT_55923 [Kickxella alabastrina]